MNVFKKTLITLLIKNIKWKKGTEEAKHLKGLVET